MTEYLPNNDELAQDAITSLVLDGPEIPPHHPIMDDIYGVGPDKPLGYLPQKTIRMFSGQHPESAADLCCRRGLTIKMVAEDESRIFSGALYVYDLKALQHLLETHQAILDKAGWSAEPADFVDRVIEASVYDKDDPDLYALIAWAFKDPRVEYGGQGYDDRRAKISIASKALNFVRSRM